MKPRPAVVRAVAALAVALLAGAAAVVAWVNVRGEEPLDAGVPPADAAVIARGRYLATVGNCVACHTARGGAEYAGGRGVDTPFGTVYAPNLTPDAAIGIGSWSAAEFRRALRHGRSKNGRLLYPAFPYPNFTLVTREDADAIYAFLRSLPPVAQARRPHELRFPYNLQVSLAIWRALYFAPVNFRPDPARSAQWNRGSYLVRGLGHCEACHAPRNVLGATRGDIELGGGLIPMQNWYAPSFVSSRAAGVTTWSEDEIVALLKTGVSPQASVMGPMAEVVFRSTQHLADGDLRAMAVFLQGLPEADGGATDRLERADKEVMQLGEKVYFEHCVSCHGAHGEGYPRMYPPLVGNRAVVLRSPNNIVKSILHGGFAPATAGNPRPFGMPPFSALKDEEIAAVTTYIRQSWGNRAAPVAAVEALRVR